MAKYDWEKIASEYITTECTQQDLCNKYGCNRSYLETRCKRENWVERREKFKSDSIATVVKQQGQIRANKLNSLINATDKLSVYIENLCNRIDEFVEDGTLNTKNLRDIVASAKDLTSTVRNLNDLPTLQEIESNRIALERLKLEQERFNADNSNEPIEIEVKLENGLEDYAG